MRRFWLLTNLLCLAAPIAVGQTKISGTESCGKPTSQQALNVGDQPNHVMAIAQSNCPWPKPLEIAGLQVKESISTEFTDTRGATSRVRGYDVGTMTNGDKYHVRYEGTATLKNGVPQTGGGTWRLFGGTGKLKGIKGRGTFKCTYAETGSTCEIEGEYELAK